MPIDFNLYKRPWWLTKTKTEPIRIKRDATQLNDKYNTNHFFRCFIECNSVYLPNKVVLEENKDYFLVSAKKNLCDHKPLLISMLIAFFHFLV